MSLSHFVRPQVTRGISAFAILVAMVCSGFTASSDAHNEAAEPAQVAASMQVAARNALAAVTPRPTPTTPSRPAPGLIEASHPLGTPAPLALPSDEYSFTRINPDGSPVTYDPCRPIHYVTRTANQPADGPQVIEEAIAAVSRATGLVFVNDGDTAEVPGFTRKPFQPERYGDRWAPVLITWAASNEDQKFSDGSALGLGGSEAQHLDPAASNYVTGEVDLNADLLATRRFSSTAFKRAVLEHELGHVVGLAHHEGQLMAAVAQDQAYGYQAGDLAGLAILGRGKCLGF